MAVASKWMAAHFNRPGFDLFGFDTFVIAGDGDLMEGVSNEAASFAGDVRLYLSFSPIGRTTSLISGLPRRETCTQRLPWRLWWPST